MFMLFPGPTRLLKVVEISWESGSRGLPGPVVISTLKGQEGMPVVEASSDRTNDATIGVLASSRRGGILPLRCGLGVG